MQLYQRGYLAPWIRCISHKEGQVLLEESHSGEVGAHKGARALMGKILRLGVYGPNVYKDATSVAKNFRECQKFASFQNLLMTTMISISSPWPFHQ